MVDIFVKESVGDDVYFGGCYPQGYFLGCLFSDAPIYIVFSCILNFTDLCSF